MAQQNGIVGGAADLYGALGDYDRAVRERNYKIAQAEDTIANLEAQFEEDRKACEELEADNDKLELECQLSDKRCETETLKVAQLRSELASVEKDSAVVTQSLERKQKLLEDVRRQTKEKMENFKAAQADYTEQYREFKPFAEYLKLDEDLKAADRTLKEAKAESEQTKQKLQELTVDYKAEWKIFVSSCVNFAGAVVANDKATKLNNARRKEFQWSNEMGSRSAGFGASSYKMSRRMPIAESLSSFNTSLPSNLEDRIELSRKNRERFSRMGMGANNPALNRWTAKFSTLPSFKQLAASPSPMKKSIEEIRRRFAQANMGSAQARGPLFRQNDMSGTQSQIPMENDPMDSSLPLNLPENEEVVTPMTTANKEPGPVLTQTDMSQSQVLIENNENDPMDSSLPLNLPENEEFVTPMTTANIEPGPLFTQTDMSVTQSQAPVENNNENEPVSKSLRMSTPENEEVLAPKTTANKEQGDAIFKVPPPPTPKTNNQIQLPEMSPFSNDSFFGGGFSQGSAGSEASSTGFFGNAGGSPMMNLFSQTSTSGGNGDASGQNAAPFAMNFDNFFGSTETADPFF